jgi:hypothetical protein
MSLNERAVVISSSGTRTEDVLVIGVTREINVLGPLKDRHVRLYPVSHFNINGSHLRRG